MHLKITHLKVKLAGLIILAFVAVIGMSNSVGTAAAGSGGRTGASFDSGTCSSCHNGGSGTPVLTLQLIPTGTSSAVATYIPGASYTLKIKVTSTTISSFGLHYGFQVTCAKSGANTDINNWGTLPSGVHSALWDTHNYIEQSATLSSITTPTISIPWTAPVSGTGTVVFYLGACIVNNNLDTTGDKGGVSSLTITESPTTGCVAPTVTATPTNVTCNGSANGSVNLTATGGTGITGYSWTGPASFSATTANISGLAPGTYTIVVSAFGGCTDTTTATITQPPVLTATVTANAPVCPGATLNFTSVTTGGTSGPGGYSYLWTGPAFSSGIADPSIPSVTASNAGTYDFQATDAHGCIYSTAINVSLNPVPPISLGPDVNICPSSSITIGEVLAGDTYIWNTSATTATITVSDTGYYYVTVTNSLTCTARDTIHIGYGSDLAVSLGPDTSICPGGSLTIGQTLTGDTYVWNTSATSSTINVIDTGVYYVTITNSLSCTGSDTIHIGYSPVPVVALGPDTSICHGGSVLLGEPLTGDTYLWSTAATTDTITVTDTGYYYVVVTNTYGCKGGDTVHVAYRACTVGIENIASGGTISLYPNPASSFITIAAGSSHSLRHIVIYNEYGAKAFDQAYTNGMSSKEIDVSRFSAGVYYVVVNDGENQLTRKLVITK